MKMEAVQRKENANETAQSVVIAVDSVRCPICQLSAGRLIRGKIYCGNCGFIES